MCGGKATGLQPSYPKIRQLVVDAAIMVTSWFKLIWCKLVINQFKCVQSQTYTGLAKWILQLNRCYYCARTSPQACAACFSIASVYFHLHQGCKSYQLLAVLLNAHAEQVECWYKPRILSFFCSQRRKTLVFYHTEHNSYWLASYGWQSSIRTITGTNTQSLIFQWQRIIISNHTAKHLSGLIVRKCQYCPSVEPGKTSRIRDSICKCSWRRGGQRFLGTTAAHRSCKQRESREAGAQRYLSVTFTCSLFHMEIVCKLLQGVPLWCCSDLCYWLKL